MKLTIPYTYLIGWPEHDMWYYGARYRRGCSPSDFWDPYKTSSHVVAEIIRTYGEPSVRQIRKVFAEPHLARRWETKVLVRLQAAQSTRWLNKKNGDSFRHCQPGYKNLCWERSPEIKHKLSKQLTNYNKNKTPDHIEKIGNYWRGKPKSDEHRQKISKSLKGRTHSEEHCQKISEKAKVRVRKPHSEETKRKIALGRMGKKHSEETKLKISQAKIIRILRQPS